MKYLNKYEIHKKLSSNTSIVLNSLLKDILNYSDLRHDLKQSKTISLKLFLGVLLAFTKSFFEVVFISLATVRLRSLRQRYYKVFYFVPNNYDTTSKHVYDRQLKRTEVFAYLGYKNPFFGDCNKNGLYFRSLLSEIKSWKVIARDYKEIKLLLIQCEKEGVFISFKSLVNFLLRTIRGASICDEIKEREISALVFSLSGNATSAYIELYFKNKIKSIHWLHGVGMGYNFDCYSDIQLVNNSADYEYYMNGLCDRVCFLPKLISYKSFIEGNEFKNVLIYTNLVHHSNEYFYEKGFDIELELINIIKSQNFEKIYLKFHPSVESFLGKNKFIEYLNILNDLGVKVVFETPTRILKNALVVSTVSTTYIDNLKIGVIPLLFNKYGDRKTFYPTEVYEQLKFYDELSFSVALRTISQLSVQKVVKEDLLLKVSDIDKVDSYLNGL